MLTKDLILSETYLRCFEDLPDHVLWTADQIDTSLRQALQSCPLDGEVWLFGYGSLIWNPTFDVQAREVATLHGWHRSFCLRTVAGRASPQTPGRMLSLESGGSTLGVALQVPADALYDQLKAVWLREMVTGAYIPTWAPITLADGQRTWALAFVANTAHPFHDADSAVGTIAPFVASATGPFGTNADYVFRLRAALLEVSVSDQYIDDLAREVERLAAARPL